MEYTDFHNGRIVTRRIMEAKGGAQVRRLQILYFLSRNGHNEHPHLIRIHHLSNTGVRLRDIKRWLGELRGKDMPESFAWSYKRTYKAGYVWQDILDDDLVTPISDNEYVIKGSEILSTNHNIEISTPRQKEDSSKDIQIASPTDIHSSDSSNYASSKTPSFGSQTSTSADDSVNHILEVEESSQKKRKTNKLEIISIKGIRKTAATSDKPHHKKSRSGGLFRNFISCGGVDTNDSAMVMASQWYKPLLKTCSGNSAHGVRDAAKEKGELIAPHAAWPLYGPNCSQCGKTFKPEKLQSHMNSCKGMKALAKASTQNISKKSTSSRNEDSVSAYLPTHKS